MTAGPYITNVTAYSANFRNQLEKLSNRKHGISQIPSQTYLHPRTRYSSSQTTTHGLFQPLHKQISGASLDSYDGPINAYESIPRQHMTSDVANDDYIQMYRLALTDPKTGIILQERKVDGRTCQKIFTGADAAQWFMEHIEGIATVDGAASIGHKLIALGIIQNVQNPDQKDFTVSPREFYCFPWPDKTEVNQTIRLSHNSHSQQSPSPLSIYRRLTVQEPDNPTVPGMTMSNLKS
jgi:hypothetical protein